MGEFIGVKLCIDLGSHFAYICALFITFRVEKYVEVYAFMFSSIFVREKEFKRKWRRIETNRRRNGAK